jgi:hypothetical protein
MQDNRGRREYFQDPIKWYDLINCGQNVLTTWEFINENTLTATYKKEEGYVEQNPTTNVVLAAFTTCWARLRLYETMDHIETVEKGRILYFGKSKIKLFCYQVFP